MPVKFYLSPQANKAGEYPIRVSISVNGARYLTTAEYKVAGSAWVDKLPDDDPRKEKEKDYVVGKYTNSKGISSKVINARLNKIKGHFAEYELNKKGKPSEAELKEQFAVALGKADIEDEAPSPAITIFDRLEEFKREQSLANQWAYGTMQCWKTFGNHLQNFNKKISFEDFDEDGLTKFIL